MLMYKSNLLRAAIIGVIATSSATTANIVSIDELGNGTQDRFPRSPAIPSNPTVKDPVSKIETLVYYLPFAVTSGDVFIFEPGATTATDLLRFEGKDLLVFSDHDEKGGTPDIPHSLPKGSQPGEPQVSAVETGNEANNGVSYSPGKGQPGYPDFAVTYNFKSDGTAIPEPGVWPLLTLGLGGLGLALRLRPTRNQ